MTEKPTSETDFKFDAIEILGLIVPILLVAFSFYLAIYHEPSDPSKEHKATPKEQMANNPSQKT